MGIIRCETERSGKEMKKKWYISEAEKQIRERRDVER